MSSSEWYTLLVEDNVTMSEDVQNRPRNYIPSPANDWELSWQLARLPGLGPEITTFLWRLLHKILPTQDRLFRMSKSRNALCQLCQEDANENLQHAFFESQFSHNVSQLLLQYLSIPIPGTSKIRSSY
jgi:hypothetical protein